MDLSDKFTWEELPTRNADTGHLTAAGWIPLIRMFSTRAAVMLVLIHTVQSTIRMATNHETVFIVWYPFDWTVSPYYELVNISQVTISKTEFSYICSYNILKLVNRYIFPFFLSSFHSVPFSSVLFHDALRLQSVGQLADKEVFKKNLQRDPLILTVSLTRNLFADLRQRKKTFGTSCESAGTK